MCIGPLEGPDSLYESGSSAGIQHKGLCFALSLGEGELGEDSEEWTGQGNRAGMQDAGSKTWIPRRGCSGLKRQTTLVCMT